MVAILGNSDSKKSVSDFYAGTSVFITGGTGYLGKVIIEKILYSCPKVEKIYLLVREKKGKTAEERMKNIIDCPVSYRQMGTKRVTDTTQVFDRLREQRPGDLQKIVLIAGDMLETNLGIKPEDELLLIDKVSVVIHSAATVKFNEPLAVALNINVEGTKKVLELCHRIKSVKAFVHISTAYCNMTGNVVEEKLYPPLMTLEKANELAKELGEKTTCQSLCGRPNTYTFTKALAENLVKDLHGDIPTIIFRPSIVTPSKCEPLEGWVDNYYGATAVLLAIGKGYCRLIIGSRCNVPDVVPVDYVSNAIIVAAAKACRYDDVKVLNFCSSSSNPIGMGILSDYFSEHCVKNSFNDFPYPYAFGIKNKWIQYIFVLFFELIPAYLADMWLYVCRKPAKYAKLQAQVEEMRSMLGYFTGRSWMIPIDSMFAIIKELSPEDARLFPCDPRDICWKDYSATFFHGVKKYLVGKVRK